jgi:ribosomal protein S18 acetylase RimI-like enzyme
MSARLELRLNEASEAEIAEHLLYCDASFTPPLTGRVEIRSYAHKIAGKATRFEAWADDTLVGLVAAYCNDNERRTAYITSVSVVKGWRGKGVASHLLEQCIVRARELGFACIELEVETRNIGAVKLYGRSGFMINRVDGLAAIMRLDIGKEA